MTRFDSSDARLGDLGRSKARGDSRDRRSRDEREARWWAPAFRDAYDDERAVLGDCSPDAHEWSDAVVASDSPDHVKRRRDDGVEIAVCSTCGCWRDR